MCNVLQLQNAVTRRWLGDDEDGSPWIFCFRDGVLFIFQWASLGVMKRERLESLSLTLVQLAQISRLRV